jgi:hypothetical protein
MSAASPIYLELIDFIVSGTTPDAMLRFRPTEASQRRVSELIEGRHRGSLSAEEKHGGASSEDNLAWCCSTLQLVEGDRPRLAVRANRKPGCVVQSA